MSGLTFQLRTRGADEGLPQVVRRELRASDPRIRVPIAMSFEAARQMPLYPSRSLAAISATFGGLALVLTLVGLYGVVMYAVSERTREFALRMALGALPRDIRRGVVRRGVAMTAVGVAGRRRRGDPPRPPPRRLPGRRVAVRPADDRGLVSGAPVAGGGRVVSARAPGDADRSGGGAEPRVLSSRFLSSEVSSGF